MWQTPFPDLAKALRPAFWAGFAVTVSTGISQFVAEAHPKLYNNDAWAPKITCVILGFLLTFTWQRALTKPGRAEASPVQSKIVAVTSTLLWFGAAIGGRAIGFV
jgi:hypothetical protein